jgi:hypothetical protein
VSWPRKFLLHPPARRQREDNPELLAPFQIALTGVILRLGRLAKRQDDDAAAYEAGRKAMQQESQRPKGIRRKVLDYSDGTVHILPGNEAINDRVGSPTDGCATNGSAARLRDRWRLR